MTLGWPGHSTERATAASGALLPPRSPASIRAAIGQVETAAFQQAAAASAGPDVLLKPLDDGSGSGDSSPRGLDLNQTISFIPTRHAHRVGANGFDFNRQIESLCGCWDSLLNERRHEFPFVVDLSIYPGPEIENRCLRRLARGDDPKGPRLGGEAIQVTFAPWWMQGANMNIGGELEHCRGHDRAIVKRGAQLQCRPVVGLRPRVPFRTRSAGRVVATMAVPAR